jgi:MFS family permease
VSVQAERSKGLQAVLALPGFRLLWLGQIFSQLADKFYIVLMVYLIAQTWAQSAGVASGPLAEAAELIRDRGMGSSSSLGLGGGNEAQWITLLATGIYAANTLPAIMLGSLAGVWADRWPKRAVMVSSNALRALLTLAVPLMLLPGPTWLGLSWGYWGLVLLTFLESCLTQFFAPAEQASIPLLVPRPLLLPANSLYTATTMAATIVGFAIGEPVMQLLRTLLAQVGVTDGEFALLPLAYGMAALVLLFVCPEEQPRQGNGASVWSDINEGISFLREQGRVRGAVLHLVLLYSLLAALYVLSISLASRVTGLGPTRFGSLLAMSGLGLTLGALVVAQRGHHFNRRYLASVGLGSMGCALVLLAQLRPSLWPTLLLCGLLGVGAALLGIPAQTTIQEDTPEHLRGKVFGLQNNLVNIALSLPLVLAGTLVGSFGVKPVLLLLALAVFVGVGLERPWLRG